MAILYTKITKHILATTLAQPAQPVQVKQTQDITQPATTEESAKMASV
jgi:5-hydroxyisourate hydrolase-like protein (transthyretin family)